MRIPLVLAVAGIFASASVSAGTQPPRIAFDHVQETVQPDVATTAPDGSELVDLAPGTKSDFISAMFPSWSPDGAKIAFEGRQTSDGSTEIYVMGSDGSDLTQLTHDSVRNGIFNARPVWSPRGEWIAFFKAQSTQNYDVWVTKPDGSQQRRLTSDGAAKGSLAWSADGTRLLYTRSVPPESRIYTVALDGSPPVALSPAGAQDFYPAWSPDGSQIAFAAPGLMVMNADGSDRRQISAVSSASPAWSPDGSELAFTGTRPFPRYASRFGIPSRQDIFVVDADGRNLRRLTGPFDDAELGGPFGSSPTWWPDGSRLFYVRPLDNGLGTTFVMNADGTCESLFAPDTPGLLDPAWQPGGGPLPPITRCAELRLSVASPRTTIALNERAEFTFTVDNDGNLPATAGVVDVPVDPRAVWSVGSDNCSVTTSDVVCQLAELPPGGSVSVTVFAQRSTPGPIRFRAHVGARQLDTDTTNNEAAFGADVLPCTVVGTLGSDVLYGTNGPDRICALPGADTIYGRGGNDFIDAGNGDDRIYPGSGRDTVIAKGGNDVIYARDGQRDWIDCGAGYDVVVADRQDVTRRCEAVSRPAR